MGGNFFRWTLALASAGASATACAVTAPQAPRQCQIIDGKALPKETGGAAAVCASFEKALRAGASNVRYDQLTIRVLSRSALVATVTHEGRQLAEQHFSVMDRDLNPMSIERFAQSLATEVAKGPKS